MRRPDTGAYVLLTKLFLRQFLENDLLSPEGDRSQMLAIVGASVISLTLFISVFTSAGYAMSILMPGEAAVLTLSDKFVYVSLAMLVTALVAAAQWDALAIDYRDAVILQPLPIRPAVLRLAKLTAVAALGAGVAVAVNIFPTIVFPWMLAFAVPQMSAAQLFQMIGTQAVITVAAAIFGFLAVVAVREWASALLGDRLFARVSPWLQTIAIVAVGSAILLLPLVSTRVGQRGFTGWRAALPSTAFVGAYESATGGFLVELPRRAMTGRQFERDRIFTAIYAERAPMFAPLARRAQVLFVGALVLVIVATALNALRTPSIVIAAARARGRPKFAALARLVFPRSAAARAGFDFALAAVWRNKTHRLTLAAAAAIGFAMVLVALSGVDLAADARPTARLLSIQPLLYGILLVAFRHMLRVPAELRANWGIQVAWQGKARAFANGVEAAALVSIAWPAIIVVVPPIAFAGGAPLAAAHALLGVAGAAIFLETLMLSYDKVPFTCTYLPGDNMRAMAPIYGLMFLIGASLFARLELAILTGGYAVAGIALLAAILIALRIVSALRPRVADIDFNEAPVTLHQLGLHN
jgi:hypothetical protein